MTWLLARCLRRSSKQVPDPVVGLEGCGPRAGYYPGKPLVAIGGIGASQLHRGD